MSDVELTDAESRRLLFASGGGRRFDEVAAEVRTILAARLSQERERRETLTRWKAEATEVLSEWDKVWDALGKPGPLGASKAASVLAEVERLAQEREQVRGDRDREWREWCAAMQDEWRALRDGVLSPGLRRAADDLDRDWSRQMVERRGRESFGQAGPRPAQEGERA